jgi:mRNA interferase MazF
MPFDFGTVVLVPFPFTSQAASKKRPAVVVSNRAYSSAKPDVIVMAITSQLRPTPALGEVWVTEWRPAGLLKASAIKPVFATLEQALVLRQLGTLHANDQMSLRKAISEIIGGRYGSRSRDAAP